MRLVLVRHGTTASNEEGRIQGWLDEPLCPQGVAQAEELAEVLSSLPLAAVLSSDLARARRTAGIIAAPHGLAVELDQRLRECRFGEWEGLTRAEIRERFPEDFERWLSKASAPTGGETYESVAARMVEAAEDVCRRWPDSVVVMVSHSVSTKMLIGAALGLDTSAARRIAITEAGVSEMERGRDAWLIGRLNWRPRLVWGRDVALR